MITAIYSGSDWSDANVSHVILPAGTTIVKEEAAWRAWYEDVYCKQPKPLGSIKKYKTLAEFIVERGGRVPTENELEIYQD